MKKEAVFLGGLLFMISYPLLAKEVITDKKVKEYILWENNRTKCFRPEIWNAKTQAELNKLLDAQSISVASDNYKNQIALMTELFGEVGTEILEGGEASKIFSQKYQQLYSRRTTVRTQEDCKRVTEFYQRIYRKNH